MVSTDPRARALVGIRVAKSKLYEAKVGIVELQRRWDRGGLGMSFYRKR